MRCVATRTECDVCEQHCLRSVATRTERIAICVRSVATHADAYDFVATGDFAATGDSSVTDDLKMTSSDVKATLQK